MILKTKIDIPISDENKALAEFIGTKFNATVEDVITIAFNRLHCPIALSDGEKIINARLRSELEAMKIQIQLRYK